MQENGLYVLKSSYFDKFKLLGCLFKHCKNGNRPVFCCFKDVQYSEIYWAIPLSEITQEKIEDGVVERVQKYMNYKEGSLGWSFYHIGSTSKPCIFNISSTFPITEAYIEKEWTVHDKIFIVYETKSIGIVRKKLRRILSEEKKRPDFLEQKITTIKNSLIKELAEKDTSTFY